MKLKFTVETTYEGTPPTVPPAPPTTEIPESPRSDSATEDYSASMLASRNPPDQQDYQYPPASAPSPPTYPPPPAYPPPQYPPAPSPPPTHSYPPTHPYPTAPPPPYSYPPPPYYPPTSPPPPPAYPPPPYPSAPPPPAVTPHPPPHPPAPHSYPPTSAPPAVPQYSPAPPSSLEINSAEKNAAILIVCLVGLQLLPAPTWEKIENLPPARILRSLINPSQPSKQSIPISSNSPPIFPLAGLSGKDALAGSIPGDCRPLGSCTRKHAGVDYSATPGWPVLAIEGGKVNEVKPDSSVGGILGIKSTSSDEVYRYVHLDRASVRPFKVGDFVQKGSVVGLIGPTFPGTSGPHGHFERYLKGKLDWKIHEHLKNAIALPKP